MGSGGASSLWSPGKTGGRRPRRRGLAESGEVGGVCSGSAAFASPTHTQALGCYMVKPHGRLVRVSFIHCWTSTPRLSTSWSATDLQEPLRLGRSHLGVGFPLRCFQRLSPPYIATRHCHWRDNRNTSGTSTPVLSYWEQLPANLQRPRQIGTELSHDVLNPARVPL